MTDIMSYRYPPLPPPQDDDDMGSPPAGYIPSYRGHHQLPSGIDMRLSIDSGHSTTERRDSYADSTTLRRSISTSGMRSPQTQALQSQDPAAEQNALSLAAAEKRRNKLGYHRTSVACGKYTPQARLVGNC